MWGTCWGDGARALLIPTKFGQSGLRKGVPLRAGGCLASTGGLAEAAGLPPWGGTFTAGPHR
jgi:hypothetical protein